MKRILNALFSSLGLVVASSAAVSQPAPPASMPMAAASMPQDCKARHDQGAEHGMPAGAAMKCAKSPKSADEAASAAAKKKVKPHDHAKFHKNQG